MNMSLIQANKELENGVWTDSRTGLMWSRFSIGQRWVNGICIGDAAYIDWNSAEDVGKSFRLAGFKDWRLPTIDELKTLMIIGQGGYNCPPSILFKQEKYRWGESWSSSHAANWGDKLFVDFHNGKIDTTFPVVSKNVRAVRINQTDLPIFSSRITINELDKGVWTDPRTGLMWARISVGQEWVNGKCVGNAEKYGAYAAKMHARGFNLDGYTDWRLPTSKELETLLITNKAGYNCSSNILFQPKNDDWGRYWSSTHDFGESGFSDFAAFDHGKLYAGPDSMEQYIRVVRYGY